MAVYMVIEIEVLDQETYREYVERVAEIVVRNGGRYLVRGGLVRPVSGGWNPERMIVIAFPGLAAAEACFASPAYLAVAPLRERSTRSRAVLLEGSEFQDQPGPGWIGN